MRATVKPFLLVFALQISSVSLKPQRLQPPKQYYQVDNDNDDVLPETTDEVDVIINSTEHGQFLGSQCEFTCNAKLHHVLCDPISGLCECDKKYPVKLSPTTGCGKPKKLGEQCLYRQSCMFADQHSSCLQVHHNAICQCKSGYHIVSLQKPTKRVFCAEDLHLLTSDFSALAGVATGIAVLTGLICFVLRLFTQARSPRPRHFANAHLAPPILFSSDTGIPLTLHSNGRSTSRASSQRTCVSTSYSRRPSSLQAGRAGGGVLVSASRAGAARAAAILLISCHIQAIGGDRSQMASAQSPDDSETSPQLTPAAGSRRPSLASVHSSGSSVRSYSTRRYEKEREQKEDREMQIRLAKMNSASNNKPPTPSPQSTDELLPAVHKQVPLAIEEECASTSFQNNLKPGTSKEFH